ncbi:MAG: DUF6786 family protein [Victivallaceae bacterium]|jgi:hypothetical protein
MKNHKSSVFGDEIAFLKQHIPVLMLEDQSSRAKIAIAPSLQARVLTSTASGDSGQSFGWINCELIASGERRKQINAFGGEDRFWLGPEGGQFSLFFNKGASFEFENWQTPEAVDWGPWEQTGTATGSASFRKEFQVANYAGTEFHVLAGRTINLLTKPEAEASLKIRFGESIKTAAYETVNSITNNGNAAWTRESGLLSIWILSMLKPSPGTVIVIPFNSGAKTSPEINAGYFGSIPPGRFTISGQTGFLKADGKFRSKIGLLPERSKGIAGSYASDSRVLTIITCSQQPGVTDYVNSMWVPFQQEPFRGDVINAYNDGPLPDGAQLGPFYELESSSPAAAAAPGEKVSHIHRTFHFEGSEADLDQLAVELLGVSLKQICMVF